MGKKTYRHYDSVVSDIMTTLDANYMALKRHPYTRGARFDEEAAFQVADLLNRSVPVTESEKIVAATFRWIAQKNRGAFIRLMFQGRFACAGQYVDGRMIEISLDSEKLFSVDATSEGFCVGEPRTLYRGDDGRSGRQDGDRNGFWRDYDRSCCLGDDRDSRRGDGDRGNRPDGDRDFRRDGDQDI
ncbi:hypothetical protein ElyMa_002594300, partial [Elysia marginata]